MPLTLTDISHTKFNSIADTLLNKTILNVKDKKYRICEIEFYSYNPNHLDEYTHKSSDQLKFGTFYFHKFKNGTYKSGTYKGMDLTFGNEVKKEYFGILIRSMMDIDTEKFIEGPCNCVNKILESFDVKNVSDFMKDKPNGINIYDTKSELHITDNDDLEGEKIMVCPRVGLSDKYPTFKDKLYRYAIFTKKIKKQKKFVDME